MGDTADGSWGSRELGGYIRREEAARPNPHCPSCDGTGIEPRETSEYPPESCWTCCGPVMRPDEVVPFLLRVLVHIALERGHLGMGQEAYEAAYDAVSDAAVAVEREIARPGAS